MLKQDRALEGVTLIFSAKVLTSYGIVIYWSIKVPEHFELSFIVSDVSTTRCMPQSVLQTLSEGIVLTTITTRVAAILPLVFL
jgi:hypothetical protein